jgi:hypothetical protein
MTKHEIDIMPLGAINPRNFSVIAVVDCQTHTGNLNMAGVLAHKICHGIGKGGGHETFAAGKIELSQALKKVKDPEDILVKRFLKEAATKGAEPVPLISRENSAPDEMNSEGDVNP